MYMKNAVVQCWQLKGIYIFGSNVRGGVGEMYFWFSFPGFCSEDFVLGATFS